MKNNTITRVGFGLRGLFLLMAAIRKQAAERGMSLRAYVEQVLRG